MLAGVTMAPCCRRIGSHHPATTTRPSSSTFMAAPILRGALFAQYLRCACFGLMAWCRLSLTRRSFTSHGGSVAELARRAGAKVLFVEYRCTRAHRRPSCAASVSLMMPCELSSLGSRLSTLSLRPSKTRSRPTSGWSTIKRWRPTGPSLPVIVLAAVWSFSPCLLCKMRTRVHSHPAFHDTVRPIISLTRHRFKVLFLLPLRPSRCRP